MEPAVGLASMLWVNMQMYKISTYVSVKFTYYADDNTDYSLIPYSITPSYWLLLLV